MSQRKNEELMSFLIIKTLCVFPIKVLQGMFLMSSWFHFTVTQIDKYYYFCIAVFCLSAMA